MATEHSATNITGGHTNAVAGGAAGFMSGDDKTKLDGVATSAVAMSLAWGVVAAPGTTGNRFLLRTGAAVATTFAGGAYPCPVAGSRTVTLTWAVAGTALAVDTLTLTLVVNGVASALVAVMGAGATGGQASTTLTLAIGDNLAVRLTQSGTEAQAAWNASVIVTA